MFSVLFNWSLPWKGAIHPQRYDDNNNMDVPPEGLENVSALLHRLRDIPPRSPERTGIIHSILSHASKVEDKEAQDFIDTLDSVLDSPELDPYLFRKSLRALRKICGLIGTVPSTYMLTEGLSKIGNVPAASGGFADIWDGTYNESRVAIKALRIYRSDDQEILKKTFCKEVVIWKRLSHPNILPLLGISTTLFPFCMVSPWMTNGNVTEYVRSNPEANRVKLLVDIAKGLDFLHSLEIVHGDLKGANILVNDSGQACLADFGLTSIMSDLNEQNAATLLSRSSGTVRWMAPETLDPEMFNLSANPNKGFSLASDVYAFSMVAMETFTGNLPFQEFRNDPSVIVKVMQGERPARPAQSQAPGLSDPVWELIQMCWQHDRGARPAMPFVLNGLEAVLYNGSPPQPAAVFTTPLDRTCFDSSSSVATPSQPIEVSSTRGDTSPRPDPQDPDLAHPEKNSGSKEAGIIARPGRSDITKWSRRLLHVVCPCIRA